MRIMLLKYVNSPCVVLLFRQSFSIVLSIIFGMSKIRSFFLNLFISFQRPLFYNGRILCDETAYIKVDVTDC